MSSFHEALLIAGLLVFVSPLLDGKHVGQGPAQAFDILHSPITFERQFRERGTLALQESEKQLQTKDGRFRGIGLKHHLVTSEAFNDQLLGGPQGDENVTVRFPTNLTRKLADQLGKPTPGHQVQTQKTQNDKLGNGMTGNPTLVELQLLTEEVEKLADQFGKLKLEDKVQTQKTLNDKLGNRMTGHPIMVELQLLTEVLEKLADQFGKLKLEDQVKTQRKQNKLGNGMAGSGTMVEKQLPTK